MEIRQCLKPPRGLSAKGSLSSSCSLLSQLSRFLQQFSFRFLPRRGEQARITSCLSNCKEFALATLMYAQDYDEGMQFGEQDTWAVGPATSAQFGVAMRGPQIDVNPYVKNLQIYKCPDEGSDRDGNGNPGTDKTIRRGQPVAIPLPGSLIVCRHNNVLTSVRPPCLQVHQGGVYARAVESQSGQNNPLQYVWGICIESRGLRRNDKLDRRLFRRLPDLHPIGHSQSAAMPAHARILQSALDDSNVPLSESWFRLEFDSTRRADDLARPGRELRFCRWSCKVQCKESTSRSRRQNAYQTDRFCDGATGPPPIGTTEPCNTLGVSRVSP